MSSVPHCHRMPAPRSCGSGPCPAFSQQPLTCPPRPPRNHFSSPISLPSTFCSKPKSAENPEARKCPGASRNRPTPSAAPRPRGMQSRRGEAVRGLCRVHTAQGQTDSMPVVQNHVCQSTVRRERAGTHAAGGRGEHWLPRQLRGPGSQAPHARGGGASVSRGLCRAVRGVSRGPR